MQDEFSFDEIRISAAFLTRYIQVAEEGLKILDIADETERREAIARIAPSVAQFLESRSRQELETMTMIVAIAYGAASAVIEGFHTLQG